MDFFEIIDMVQKFSRANPLIAIAAGLIILYLFYRRPGLSFFILFVVVLLAGIYFTVMSMSSSGAAKKERLIKKSEPEIITIDPSGFLR